MDPSLPRVTSRQAALSLSVLYVSLLVAALGLQERVSAQDARAQLAAAASQQEVRFNRDVRPLLADRCFHCHGPDAHDRKGKLRLDRADGPQGATTARDGIQAIRPGSLEDSELWYRLTTTDEHDLMPPLDSNKQPLDAQERELIKRWIEQGAPYQDHWAFVAPTQPSAPQVADEAWLEQPLDGFVLRQLESQGLAPSPKADKRTLLRRASFDLTGLPPTLDEIQAFLEDDDAGAYERVLDRLLSSPRFGEHRAKYWLDLVRFADTNGLHHDHYRDQSPYRDWVIRSLNANLPYDRFVTEQLAGDLIPDPTDQQLIASGFNRLHMIIDGGTMLPEESLARNVIDRVSAVGTAFMGLTVQCAVCHDHKYDPIEQKDFYQLSAFFNNLDGAPETGGRSGADFRRGLQPPYISFPTEDQSAGLESFDQERATLQARHDELQASAESTEEEAVAPDEEYAAQLKHLQDELKRVQRERTELMVSVAGAMVMKERTEVRPAHILVRGAYDNPGELVERNVPGFLPSMEPKDGLRSRLDLAQWLVAPEQPLTARVAVNQFWQQLFGTGIVKTSEDFGTQGEWPSHLELLDHLARSFVESGWDVKALFKRIMLSATYQQAGATTRAQFEADPENRMLSRASRFRMDAEMIRDQILASSGILNTSMYGPSVKPPQPAGIWKAVSLPDSYPRIFEADQGEQIYRRSLYTFWKRGMPPPQMTMLDAPNRESCAARRERTNTPLQALLLMNEAEYLRAAGQLASRTLAIPELSPTQRLTHIYETITSKLPSTSVSQKLLNYLQDVEQLYEQDTQLAEQLCADLPLPDGCSNARLAAWTMLVSTVYNLDITKTRE
ncbi:MAG: hypothetical protein ACI9HE_003732 [Planctomycetota bacterium]|jgi:hypothetical protein